MGDRLNRLNYVKETNCCERLLLRILHRHNTQNISLAISTLPEGLTVVDDRELDNMLWRAFYLGLHVMATLEGTELTFSHIQSLAKMGRDIANSEITHQAPSEIAAKFPVFGDTLRRMSST